jgi:hypothetical protein
MARKKTRVVATRQAHVAAAAASASTAMVPVTDAASAALESVGSDGPVERALAEIRSLYDTRTLSFFLDVGHAVISHLFGGNADRARRKGPKDVSLKKLAEHRDLPISTRQLYLAVGVYALLARTGQLEEVRTSGLLGYSHIEAVLPAPPEEQPRLIAEALKHQWTVRQLKEQVALLAKPRRGGPRAASPILRSVRRLGGDVERLTSALDKQDAINPREMRALFDVVKEALERLRRLHGRLTKEVGKSIR